MSRSVSRVAGSSPESMAPLATGVAMLKAKLEKKAMNQPSHVTLPPWLVDAIRALRNRANAVRAAQHFALVETSQRVNVNRQARLLPQHRLSQRLANGGS